MSRIIASNLIQIRHYLHEAEVGFLNQDAKYIANQLKMVSVLAESLAYDIENANNDPFSTPDSQMAQASSSCCGGACQPPAAPQTKSSNHIVHPGFAAFGQQSWTPQTSNSGNRSWTPVVSSNIKAIAYDKNNDTLAVKFVDDDVYEYSDVPSAIYSAFLIAPSKGRFFHQNIRDVYNSVKLS